MNSEYSRAEAILAGHTSLYANDSTENDVKEADAVESIEDSKEQIRRDVFTTEEEAAARATRIGCEGTHSIDENGNKVFMPCKTHEEYVELTGRDVSGYHYDKDKRKKPKMKEDDLDIELEDEHFEFISDIKAYEDDQEEEEKDYGKFEGYASVFGNTDLGNDVINMGAFRKSLRKKGPKGVKLLYQHKSDMPIGVFDSIKEDDNGLYVKGRLALKTTAGKEAYELLKMGALDAMSIGFRANPKEVSYDKRTNKRMIGEVDLMEISLVTFPMNPQAKIRSVKGQEISIREWENGLREAFSISRSEAKVAAKAVSQAFELKTDSEKLEGVDTNSELVDAVKHLTETLKTL